MSRSTFRTLRLPPLLALLFAAPSLGQGGADAPAIITAPASPVSTAGASQMTASQDLKLAASYTASSFLSDWDFYTDDDPTGGYVNYVSKSDGDSLGLSGTLQDGSFYMRADAENTADGRGRNSIRISSKDKFGDGVYILDMNHMPVGCGTWPAFWTVTEDGWPVGGEIDIIEGANALPQKYGAAYNATVSSGLTNATSSAYPVLNDVSSLHASTNCQLDTNAYMTGTVGGTECSAYLNGNEGCGAELAGESLYGVDSFGAGMNSAGGGWYALWRDLENSGGVYVYYWPRNATNIPDDVRYPNTSTTDVSNWGQPGANLSVPSCKSDFGNHVIVFDLTFCGDYAGATYTQSGCPSTCASFVENNPKAFAEAYWSINSLRVYNVSGKPIRQVAVNKGLVIGVVVGVVAIIALVLAVWLRYRQRMKVRRSSAAVALITGGGEDSSQKRSAWAAPDSDDSDKDVDGAASQTLHVPYALAPQRKLSAWTDNSAFASSTFHASASSQGSEADLPLETMAKPQERDARDARPVKKTTKVLVTRNKAASGPTKLEQGKTARDQLAGETRRGHYHDEREAERDGGAARRASGFGVQKSWVG